MDTAVTVAAIAAGAAVFSGFMAWRGSKRATDVNERATELAWVKEIRQDAADARREVDALQEQVRTLTRQLSVVTREAEHWIAQYQLVHRAVWRPGVTLEQVRDLLGPDTPQAAANGRG